MQYIRDIYLLRQKFAVCSYRICLEIRPDFRKSNAENIFFVKSCIY